MKDNAVRPANTGRHYYCVGVAGAGVSALASILKSEGHRVSGSDEAAYPPVSTYLERLGVTYHNGFDAALVPDDVDAAIIGTSAKLGGAENPEIAELRRRGLPCSSFADFLGAHTASRANIVVAGSFGKSTLSAMLAYLLKACGRDPGWFIGAVPLDLETTGHWGGDAEMILEGDEYVVSSEDHRSKFLLYRANDLLISSLTHDHFNMFPTFESYQKPFETLVSQFQGQGVIACARGYPELARIVSGREVVWYGLNEGPGWGASDIAIGERTLFTLTGPGGLRLPLETELLGLHNIENLVGASALLLSKGLATPEALARAVPGFRGVARRLEKKTRRSSAPVYEGFGSSLEKAESAIAAMALHFPERRRIVVFEPHAFSWRNTEALAWYDRVFREASLALILPPPLHGADRHSQLSQAQIVARVQAAGVAALGVADAEETLAVLGRDMRGDEAVLLLSSGPLADLPALLPAWAEARFG